MPAIKLKKTIIITFFSLLLFFTQNNYAAEKEVKIGVLAVWGDKITRKMWQPTINYLNKKVTGYKFKLKTLKLGQTTQAVERASISFIITNPGNYIDLESRFGISRLATLKTKKQNKSSNQFSAVIFTNNNRDDIQNLKDLNNKSFMGVKKKAFGGFQMAWLELKRNGIDPFKDFSSLQFSGFPQDKIVHAVLNGEVDAGTVRTTTLERMAAEGLIDINEFKILNKKTKSDFPYLHSTQLYPEWPVAKLKQTSEILAKIVSITLLKIDKDSFEAQQAKSSGWTVPLDYSPVRNLFKELNLPPYKQVLPGFFERYWLQSLLFLMLILQPLLLYIHKLKTDIQHDAEKIAQSETQWSNALDFLDEPMYMVDLNDRVIRANKAFYEKIKAKAEDVIGKVVTDFTHPEGEERPCAVCQARKDLQDTILILEADNPVNKAGIPLEISVKIIRDKNNKAIGIIQRMRDLTESRKAEKALRRSESLFKELLNATPDPLIVANDAGTIILVNSKFEDEFGYSRKEIIGHKIEKLVPERHAISHVKMRTQYTSNPSKALMRQGINFEGLHKDGHSIPVEINLSPFVIDEEKFIIAAIHNISERIRKEKELKRLASFPEFDPNPIIEFNEELTVTYSNPAALKLFPTLTKENTTHEVFNNIDKSYSSLKKSLEHIRNIEVGDSIFEQKIIYNPETKLFRMYIWDITKLRNLTKKMTYQATHDVLTNLINRREFERR